MFYYNHIVTCNSKEKSKTTESYNLNSDLGNRNTIQLISYLDQIKKNRDSLDGLYVIIPTSICPTCIDKLKEFILTNRGAINVQYIFSGKSFKDIRLAIGDSILDSRKVWLDDNEFWFRMNPGEDEVAKIFYTRKGKVFKSVSLFPSILEIELINLAAWNYANYNMFYLLRPKYAESRFKEAPSIKGWTTSGEVFDMKKSSSEVYLINFWSIYCRTCLIEMPILNQLYDEYKDSGVEFISICLEDAEVLNDFLERKETPENFIKFPIIAGAGELIDKYNAKPFPVNFIVNKDGMITDVSSYVQSENEKYKINGLVKEFSMYYMILKGQIDKNLILGSSRFEKF